jgi:DNA-binding CsgD family transcriptional regulator
MALSEFDHERMAYMHSQGYTAREIGAAVGCTARTVARWRASTDRSSPTPPTAIAPISEERLAQAAQMLADGASQRDTSRTLGIAPDTLHRHFPDAVWSTRQTVTHARIVRTLNRMPNNFTALTTHLSDVA